MIREFLGLSRSGGLSTRASIENPRVSLQDPAAWDEMFGGGLRTDAGILVSHAGALKLAPVWQAVSMISGDVAKLPLEVFRRTEGTATGGPREADKAHPAYWLVRRRANRERHAFGFWRTMLVHALLWGNGYAYIDRNGRGEPIELLNLLPDRTAPERDKGKLVYVTETQKQDGSPWLRPIPAADVLHIRGISLDAIGGVDPTSSARNAWGVGLAAEGFAAKFFANGVRTAGILEVPAAMPKGPQDRLIEGFRRESEGPDNWFRTVILRDGAKFHTVSIDPQNAEMSATRDQAALDTARFFNLAPSRLGVKGSTAYNSKSADNQNYLDCTLSPWLVEIASECWLKLLSRAAQDADSHFFEHNTAALLALDTMQRHQVYAIGIRNGMYSPDECRSRENWGPRTDGRGGEYVDVVAASGGNKGGAVTGTQDNGQNQNTGDNPGGTDPGGTAGRTAGIGPDRLWNESPTDDDPARLHSRRRIVFGLGANARRKARNPRALLEWIDGGLSWHAQEARELLGDDSMVASWLVDLRAMVERVGAAELPAAVEALAKQRECEV